MRLSIWKREGQRVANEKAPPEEAGQVKFGARRKSRSRSLCRDAGAVYRFDGRIHLARTKANSRRGTGARGAAQLRECPFFKAVWHLRYTV
jgi:hypothetical protein